MFYVIQQAAAVAVRQGELAVDEATRNGCKLRGICPFSALSRCTIFVTPDFSTHKNNDHERQSVHLLYQISQQFFHVLMV
jgi:hypothetical protein